MDGPVILVLVFIVLGALILLAFGFAMFSPERFLRAHRRTPTPVVVVGYIVAFLVISTPIFFGLVEFFDPLPYEWGSVDEDGDFVSMGESIASFISLFLGIWILAVPYAWVSEKLAAQELLDELRLTNTLLEDPHYLEGMIKRWEKEIEWADRKSARYVRRTRLLETAKKWRDHIDYKKESAAAYAIERLKSPRPKPIPVGWTGDGIKRSRPNLQVETATVLADLEESTLSEFDGERVTTLFQTLRDLARSHVGHAIGKSTPEQSTDLTPMLCRMPGATLEDATSVVAIYCGSPHDGHTEISATRKGSDVDVLSALRFSENIEGASSSFFIAHELETFGAYSHGLYGRDHRLILTWDELAQFVTEHRWAAPDDERLAELSVSPGLLVERSGDAIIISAMTGLTTGSLERRRVKLSGGSAEALKSLPIVKGRSRTYY